MGNFSAVVGVIRTKAWRPCPAGRWMTVKPSPSAYPGAGFGLLAAVTQVCRRPIQSSIPFKKVPKDAKFEAPTAAGCWPLALEIASQCPLRCVPESGRHLVCMWGRHVGDPILCFCRMQLRTCKCVGFATSSVTLRVGLSSFVISCVAAATDLKDATPLP